MACGPLFMSLVVVVSGQRLLWDGAQLVGSHLQGQDKWHPLHFGVSPEWLWDSAPASSPWWRGLLQLCECSPGQSFPFAWALLGVTLKLVLRFLWKWGGPYTPDLNEAHCWFSTKWDVLWPWTLLFCWWVCGSWEALLSWLEHLWWSFPPLLPSPGGKAFTGKVIMAFSGSAAGSDGLVHMRTNSKAVNEHLCTAELTRSMVHLRSMASSEACLEVGELFPTSWTKEPKERSLKWSLEKLLISLHP